MSTGSVIRTLVGIGVLFFCWIIASWKQNRGASDPSNGLGGPPRSPFDRDAQFIYYGATLMDEDSGYRPDWKAAMLREFGDEVEPDLDRLFDMARDVTRHPREEWMAQIRKYSRT